MGVLAARGARGRVLVVEDDAGVRFGLSSILRTAGYEVVECETCAEAARLFRRMHVDIVVTDLRLPDGNAVELLLPHVSSAPVLIVTGYGTIDIAVDAVKRGAEDFLTKPVDTHRLLNLVQTTIDRQKRVRSAQRQKFVAPKFSSPKMKQLEEQVEKLRGADCTILMLGETGTGKSALARRLHNADVRSNAPFVEVNCAGLTRELVESELFGHERGAFTGAHSQKIGLFETANTGTLFLDEIGDIDAQVQPKVLKVIEEKRFRRVGDVREREVDVRLIAATHRDLRSGTSFRADLYYRISTVTLILPSLRERVEDIMPLTHDILRDCTGGEETELAPDAELKLTEYDWPGNIRELKNVLERAVILRQGPVIRASDIHLDTPTPPVAAPSSNSPSVSRLLAGDASTATRTEVEREHIQLALAAENGRVEAAARRLGIPRSTLYQKLKLYGITTSRAR